MQGEFQPSNAHRFRFGQPADRRGPAEIEQNGEANGRAPGQHDDAEAPHFDPPRQGGGWFGQKYIALPPQQNLIVGHELRTPIDQAQREVGLAGSGRSAEQRAESLDRDAGGMKARDAQGLPGSSASPHRQAHDESRAEDAAARRGPAVLGHDGAIVRFHDLLGNA